MASQLFCCFMAGTFVSSFVKTEWLGFLLGAVVAAPLGFLITKLADFLLRPVLKCSGRSVAYTVLDVGLLLYPALYGSVGAKEAQIALVTVAIFVVAALFAKSIWAVTVEKLHKTGMAVLSAVTGVLTVMSIFFMAGDGFTNSYVSEYQKYGMSEQVPHLEQQGTGDWEQVKEDFTEYGELGDCTVATLEYSPYKDVELKTEPVDLTRYVMEEEGFHRVYRDLFQDYDLDKTPVAGKIWYPLEKENCPVIFMAHGNHSITEESYLGYDYLGEYFASHGYVFVSVDENALNERSGENDGRAVLLLENLKAVKQFNEEEENPLYGKMDYENIALAGHSRGGEMIADAYLFNECDTYPSNGMFDFDYHFSIKTLLAVAPSVNQYQPADHAVELSDVNYLVLQGANDQDINVFMGNEQYENISFSGEGDYLKSSLYIAGANHGQFNTLWGNYDMEPPFSWWLNVKDLIPEEEQRYLLKVFARAFFDATLKGETDYESLLTNASAYEAYLPDTLYVQQYERSDFSCLADFEEDADLESVSDDSSAFAEHMSMWTEEKVDDSGEGAGERENHALYLKWKKTEKSCYEMNLEENVSLRDASVCFDICNLTEGMKADGSGILDFTVVLMDENGTCARAQVGEYKTLYPAFSVGLSKIQYLFGEMEEKHQFQTVTLPIENFKQDAADFDETRVSSITFLFDEQKSGELWLDNIGILGNK